MKRNIVLKIIIIFTAFFSYCTYTFAYSCKFTGDIDAESSWLNSLVGDKGYFVVDIDPTNKTITPDLGDVNEIIDPYIDSEWTYERIIENLSGKCPDKVLFCKLKNDSSGGYGQFLVMNDTLEAKLVEKKKISIPRKTIFGTTSLTYIYKDRTSCVWFNYSKDGSTSDSSSITYECENYANFINDLEKYYETDKSKYKETKNEAKVYCTTLLENLDAYNSCTKECLGLNEYIQQKEQSDNTVSSCGFSERLLVWASNILRWIKYILPVAVIIFGILDFIKAIGADKDDEMKKAQKRFIIRLIAAALVFIIPLILEFVLDKMGFGYNDCGLF